MIDILNSNNTLLKMLMHSLNDTKETKLVRRKILGQIDNNFNQINKLKGKYINERTAKIKVISVRFNKSDCPIDMDLRKEAVNCLAREIKPLLRGSETDSSVTFELLAGKPV